MTVNVLGMVLALTKILGERETRADHTETEASVHTHVGKETWSVRGQEVMSGQTAEGRVEFTG